MITCPFCQIAHHETSATIVFENDVNIAFLDSRPLFAGHTLLIPKEHITSFSEFPLNYTDQFFRTTHLLSEAVEKAMESQGTFIAINNKVSQSVPHLHIHIVPRTKGDGLRGFFWPRRKYSDEHHISEVAEKIRKVVGEKS